MASPASAPTSRNGSGDCNFDFTIKKEEPQHLDEEERVLFNSTAYRMMTQDELQQYTPLLPSRLEALVLPTPIVIHCDSYKYGYIIGRDDEFTNQDQQPQTAMIEVSARTFQTLETDESVFLQVLVHGTSELQRRAEATHTCSRSTILFVSRQLMRAAIDDFIKNECRVELANAFKRKSEVIAAVNFGAINCQYDAQIDKIIDLWMSESNHVFPTKSNISTLLLTFSTKHVDQFAVLLNKILQDSLSITATLKLLPEMRTVDTPTEAAAAADDDDDEKQESHFLPYSLIASFDSKMSSAVTKAYLEIGPMSDLADGVPNFETIAPKLVLVALNKLRLTMDILKSYTPIFNLTGIRNRGAVVFAPIEDVHLWTWTAYINVSTTSFAKMIRHTKKQRHAYLVI